MKIENEADLFKYLMSLEINKTETEIVIPGKGRFGISYYGDEGVNDREDSDSDESIHYGEPLLLWNDVLLKVQQTIDATRYETWFKNTTAIQIDERHIGIVCHNSFQSDWLKAQFNPLIFNLIEELTGKQFELEFLTE